MKLKPQFRTASIGAVKDDERTVELSFSSTAPYERYWGIEILDHSPGAIDMGRLESDAPLLFNHDRDVVIGVVEKAWVDGEKAYARVRFGNNAKAQEVYADVRDGILKNVSVGYRIHEMVLVEEKNDTPVYRVTKWEPFEVSIVSVPADPSVGIGRALEESEVNIQKGEKMAAKEEQKKSAEETRQKVDVNAVKEEAMKKERERVREIMALGERFGQKELAQKAVDGGVGLDEFRKQILEKMETSKPIDTKSGSSAGVIGMSEKEVRQYSLLRAIRALANPHDKRAQEAAKYEFEISQEAQRQSGLEAQGILVPLDVLARDLTVTGTNPSGASVVATDLLTQNFIELLRAKSAIIDLATHLTGLRGNVAIPRQTKAIDVYEVGETDAIPESDIELDQVTMSPKRLGATTGYSKQLLAQESMDVEMLIKNDIIRQIALKIDAIGVQKILNETGVGLVEIGPDGGAPKWEHVVGLESLIVEENADAERMQYVINGRTQGYFKTTPKVDGYPAYIIENGQINGYGYKVSNLVPNNLTKGNGTNLSAILFGNYTDLLVGFWGGIDIVVDPYSRKKEGVVEITADQFYDIAIRHPESFAVIKDAAV